MEAALAELKAKAVNVLMHELGVQIELWSLNSLYWQGATPTKVVESLADQIKDINQWPQP